jgi:uncharacterized protein
MIPRRVIDAHTHFFPERMFAAIWEFFERGRWPIAYRRPAEELTAILASHGAAFYTVLNYVKRPGQAEALNAWTAEFCRGRPEAIPFATVHAGDPDPWATARPYLEEQGFRGIKIQPLVSEFGIDDPRLEPTLARLEALGKILVVHAGTAPYPNAWLGLARLEKVMEAHPDLTVVLPHLGAYEVNKAFALLEKYPNMHLDTAMIFVNTNAFDTKPIVPRETLEKFADRILFGSDFPNIPYQYEEALASIERLGLSGNAAAKIFYDNAARLFGVGPKNITMEKSDVCGQTARPD